MSLSAILFIIIEDIRYMPQNIIVCIQYIEILGLLNNRGIYAASIESDVHANIGRRSLI